VSFEKNRPKYSPIHCLSKLIHNFCSGEKKAKMRSTSVIFIKLPKVNSHPMGENSPDLVTLLGDKAVGNGTTRR
jgi:hypothetical protein